MQAFCHSCGMPIAKEQQARGNYCQYCSDEGGKLYPREQVQKGIADWLKSFSPADDTPDFMGRAAQYMKAMPAWADK